MKKLTIAVDDAVYAGLHRMFGKGKIGQFLSNIARPYVVEEELEAAYREMASDEEYEKEAHEWIEGLIGDADHQAR